MRGVDVKRPRTADLFGFFGNQEGSTRWEQQPPQTRQQPPFGMPGAQPRLHMPPLWNPRQRTNRAMRMTHAISPCSQKAGAPLFAMEARDRGLWS